MTNWQKQFDKLCVADPRKDDRTIKDFISSLLEAQAKEEMIRRKKEKIMTAEATRDFIVGQIERMHLWSKGTAEGTRKDILAKLKTLTK